MSQNTISKEQTLAAWREQLAAAAQKPWLASLLLRHGERVLERFLYFYRQLRALPKRLRRRLKGKLAPTLAGAALVLALSNTPAAYAFPASPEAHINGSDCALIDAITAANTDTATGACNAGTPGADTIELLSDVTLTSVNNSGAYGQHSNGLPVITSAITIEGAGHTITRDSGAPAFRIFLVGTSGNLTLNDTIVTGGAAQNVSSGGIFNFGGALTLNNSTVSGNNFVGVVSLGVATINNSTISGNGSGGVASADFSGSTSVTVTNSTISGNSGPGVDISSDFGSTSAMVTNSTISGNSGPGVYSYTYYGSVNVTVTNSTISGNSGPGVDSYAYYGSTSAMVTNSTISGNSGPGVHTDTRYSSANANVTLVRSLISGNTASEVTKDGGTVTADSYNLFGHSGETNASAFSAFTPGTSDITATSDGTAPTALASILDATLQNNGGDTETHALVTGSPAVDAAPTGPAADQRGVSRPQGPAFDIGAFELEQASNEPPTADADGPYLVAVNNTIPLDGTGTDPDNDPLTFSWIAEEGSFDDASLEDPNYTAGGNAGIFDLTLTVDDGSESDSDTAMVVVYDPDGGFVTGGGKIYSQPGAYQPDETLEGPANFGFVSKYKKGASEPTGQTEFNFQVAGMNFHSDAYEWLVVANHKAMYKGTGTINGSGNYGFLLSAIDADLTPSTDVDLFRIKIWDKDDNDAVVYDNQLGADDDADPTTAITQGQIKIHNN